MQGEFKCDREVLLPADPETVWQAVATKAGNAAWLFPNDVDPDSPVTTVWEPPHRFATRVEQGDWFNALEFEIEARDGGRALLRYSHSGIFTDDWDSQHDAVQQHTDFYLHTLAQYLEHFAGRPATYIGEVPQGIPAPASSAVPDGFQRLLLALGVAEDAAEGDAVALRPDGLPPIDGVIDYRRGSFASVRSEDALYCLFGRNAFGSPVAVSIHSFAPGVDAEAVQEQWRRWLAGVFA